MFEIKALEKEPMLLSLYAETLRFGVQIHIPRCAPHDRVQVEGSEIPRDKLILVSTSVAHNDEQIWDPCGGNFPVHRFWAKRFLSTDSSLHASTSSPSDGSSHDAAGSSEETFSLQGLEGAWIPFGG